MKISREATKFSEHEKYGKNKKEGGDSVAFEFDYSKLLGRIREYGLTQEKVAESIGISNGTMSAKLNNKANFTSKEMIRISRMFDISKDDMGAYFFTPKVQKF